MAWSNLRIGVGWILNLEDVFFGTWIIKATSEQGSRGNDVNLQDFIPRKKGKSTRKKMWRRT